MDWLRQFLIGLSIMLISMVPFSVITCLILWKIRSQGIWTLLLSPVLAIVFILLAILVFPAIAHFHAGSDGNSPIIDGVSNGCFLSILVMGSYHMTERKKKQAASGSSDDPAGRP